MNKAALPLLLASALSLTSCATTVTGVASDSAGNSPGPVIPAGLDVGKYATTLRSVPPPSTEGAWIIEGNRMGTALISVNEVDPRLKIGGIALRSYPVLRGTQLRGRVPDAAVDAFYDNDMRVGMTTTRGDSMDNPTVALRVGLYRFDSAEAATKAHAAIRAATTRQRPVVVSGANTDGVLATEFKPGTVDSYRVEGPFVINVSGTAPTTAEAAGFVGKAYGMQVPRVKGFAPTPTGSVQSLPSDKDGMLARTIFNPSTSEALAALSNSYFDLPGLLLRIPDISDAEKYQRAGVDAVGQGMAFVYRTRDAAAARTLRESTRKPMDATMRSVPGPAGVTAVSCTEHTGTDGYVGCSGNVGRYFFTLSDDTLVAAQQAAAAQYALLAKNP